MKHLSNDTSYRSVAHGIVNTILSRSSLALNAQSSWNWFRLSVTVTLVDRDKSIIRQDLSGLQSKLLTVTLTYLKIFIHNTSCCRFYQVNPTRDQNLWIGWSPKRTCLDSVSLIVYYL